MSADFVTHAESEIDTAFCQLQGTVQATLEKLTIAFGSPLRPVGNDKVLLEWRLRFDSGEVATIYCWREPAVPAADELITWRIGARTVHGVQLVHDAFRGAHGWAARATA